MIWWEGSLELCKLRVAELVSVCDTQEERIKEFGRLLKEKEEERVALFQETVNLRNAMIRAEKILQEGR